MNTLPIFAHFRQTAIAALAVLLGVFVFYTSFNGPFESLVQRAIFVMMITALAVLMHPLFEGSRLRPLGIAIDAVIVGVVTVSGANIIANYETIM
ncbi:MAG: C4-dicarboxylate ABC transporter permease, partial [Roseobacter sp.]|nr:C4-dicarboxylate ABC transporter permease [Roseobacter sp.]